MDMIRRFTAFALVLFAAVCVAAWAVWYNEGLNTLAGPIFPIEAEDFPLGPFRGPLVFAFGSFFVAYLVYPPNRDRDDD